MRACVFVTLCTHHTHTHTHTHLPVKVDGDADLLQHADDVDEVGVRLDLVDGRQVGLQGRRPQLVDAPRVHARAVEDARLCVYACAYTCMCVYVYVCIYTT